MWQICFYCHQTQLYSSSFVTPRPGEYLLSCKKIVFLHFCVRTSYTPTGTSRTFSITLALPFSLSLNISSCASNRITQQTWITHTHTQKSTPQGRFQMSCEAGLAFSWHGTQGERRIALIMSLRC